MDIEKEIQAKGLTAPRVTRAAIDDQIQSIDVVQHNSASGQVLRWAVLNMRNGFAITGKPSCAVSPFNDNAELGKMIAIDNAIEEAWALLGFELKSKLANEANRIENIARICNDANAAYCAATGDFSYGNWDETPEAIKESCRDGVRKHLANPDMTPEASHEAWMQFKAADGYTYGPVRDEATKQHPCMVPYDQLPTAQKAKDHIFRAAVHAANRSL